MRPRRSTRRRIFKSKDGFRLARFHLDGHLGLLCLLIFFSRISPPRWERRGILLGVTVASVASFTGVEIKASGGAEEHELRVKGVQSILGIR
jgi:hypothetical protein